MVGAILVVLLFLLPNFKPRRARFESLNYGRNPHSQKEHIEVKSSLSIRRFWGKGERWKRKRESSPSPLGRPDTQARLRENLSLVLIGPILNKI